MQTKFGTMRAFFHMLRPFRKNIKYKLFLIFVLTISIPVLFFGVVSYQMSAATVERDFIKYKSAIVEQISKNIDENIKNLTRQSMAVYTNLEDILYVLNTPSDQVDTHYLESYKRMDNYFQSVLQSNDRFDSITLISLDGKIKYYADKQSGSFNLFTVENETWFKETLQLRGFALLREPHFNEFIDDHAINKKSVISISRAVIDLSSSEYNPSGIMLVDQNVNKIQQILKNTATEQGEITIVLSKTGEVVYSDRPMNEQTIQQLDKIVSSKSNNSFDYVFSKQKMLATFFESPEYKWKVISLLPYTILQDKSLFLKNINISLFLVLILLAFLISIVFSNIIITPLKKLIVAFRSFQQGDFNARIIVKGEDELSLIGTSFNIMVANTRNLIEQKYEMTLLRNQSELKALQNQINPHFLYNTLTSIKIVINKKDFRHSSMMVQHLSDIFRYNLNNGDAIVPFSDELEHIKRYLFILEFRFKDRFEVHYDIDEQVMNCTMLRLTLQPLVENALYHGLEPQRRTGEIRITAKAYDDKLYIYIHDNGLGIPQDKLDEINASLDGSNETFHRSSHGNIGLSNVNSRIKYHFGPGYGLKMISAPNTGTTVKIVLPNGSYHKPIHDPM